MKKTKNKVIKIRVLPIILLMLTAIIFYTLTFTDTMEQIGARINNNAIREVQTGDIAKILRDGKEYGFSTFEEAIEEVKDKETIVILENVNLNDAITINKSITINGSDWTITTKGITNTADLTIQNATITDAETEETIAINNTGKLYLKSVTISNINGTGIKNTGTLGFKNIQTTIIAKNAIDGKINEVPLTYGVKIIKSNSNNPQTATIINEATALSNNYEMICGNIFYEMSEIVDTAQDENNVLIKQDIFDNGNCEFKLLKNINVTYDKPIKIQNGESVSINLNNKEISINLNRMPSMFSNSGKLKLENGSLTKSSSYSNTIENEGALEISNITLNSGTANRAAIYGSGGTVNIKGSSNLIMYNRGPGNSTINRWNM